MMRDRLPMLWLFLAMCVVGCGIGRAAEPECSDYVYGMFVGDSPEDVLGQFISWSNDQSAATETSTGTEYEALSCTGLVCDYTTQCVDATEFPGSCGGGGGGAGSITVTEVPGECDPLCEDMAGKRSTSVYDTTKEGNSPGPNGQGPSTSCETGCKVALIGSSCIAVFDGAICANTYEHLGASCDVGGGEEELPNQANCVTGAAGRFCAKKSDNNCGTVNGVTMCATEPPSGSCVAKSGGGLLCATDAEGPDDGTPGNPAQPDAIIKNQQTGTTANYFNVNTVNNSSSTVITTQPNDGKGGGGGGGGGGFDMCEGLNDCVGGLDELQGFEASVTGFMGRVQASPLLSAVDGIGSNIPDGACEAPAFEAFGQTLSLQGMCDTIEPVVGILSIVMMFVWGVFAVRVFLSA